MFQIEQPIDKYNEYIKSDGEKHLDECCVLIHDIYNEVDAEEKENIYLYVLSTFPETIAYAMLKLSSIKLDVVERFYDEYRDSYKSWLDDIETLLVIAFGDVKIFLTYAKLYISGMNAHVDTLMKQIEKKFKEQKEEKERLEWIHKKIY